MHGFRATASTILNEKGFNGDVIERQLAHSESNKSRAAYDHSEHMEKRKQMMQWWADYLDTQLAKGEESRGSASWKRGSVHTQTAGMKPRGSLKPQTATHVHVLKPTA